MSRTKETARTKDGDVEEEQEGAQDIGRRLWREARAAPLEARDGGAPRDPPVPTLHGPAAAEGALPAPRARGVRSTEGGSALPEQRDPGCTGGNRVVHCVAARGHEPRVHPQRSRDDPAQGHPPRALPARRACLEDVPGD
ncbi:hypothetical protein ERJ75_000317600 [Trypanosoma vivax]|nr:hypothetical protein ERJ75_000317600 [Trypanosoma vivax]